MWDMSYQWTKGPFFLGAFCPSAGCLKYEASRFAMRRRRMILGRPDLGQGGLHFRYSWRTDQLAGFLG